MRDWLRRLWEDEDAFRTAIFTWGRGLIAFAGYLIQQGIIPTGVEGGGGKYGMLLLALAFFVPGSGRIAPSKDK